MHQKQEREIEVEDVVFIILAPFQKISIAHKCWQVNASILLSDADVIKVLSIHDGVASAACEYFFYVKEAGY